MLASSKSATYAKRGGGVTQVTSTPVTFAPATVLALFLMVQVWLGTEGEVLTVMLYSAPSAMAGNVKGPLPEIARLLPPLFCSTKPLPTSPETLLPTL